MTMKRRLTLPGFVGLTIVLAAMLLSSFGCGKEEKAQAKNLEQIYKEEGIPVRTETVTLKPFKSELSFNAVLKGIKESSAYARIEDKVEKIFVKVGDWVEKDVILLTFPTDSPQARYNQARVAFENAKTAYERIENLYKSGGVSLQERDNIKAAYEVAEANWEAARQSIKVKAPIAGYVTRVDVSETDDVKMNDELFTIAQTGRLKAQVWLSEAQIYQVEAGMSATAGWRDRQITGKVVQVDMAMNQEKKAFQALVEFDNPDNRLMPGTTVEIRIATFEKSAAVVVKRQHIVNEQGKSFVYVVQDGKAERREVETGREHVLDVEIAAGLDPGDELIVEGQLLLEPGSIVKVVK